MLIETFAEIRVQLQQMWAPPRTAALEDSVKVCALTLHHSYSSTTLLVRVRATPISVKRTRKCPVTAGSSVTVRVHAQKMMGHLSQRAKSLASNSVGEIGNYLVLFGKNFPGKCFFNTHCTCRHNFSCLQIVLYGYMSVAKNFLVRSVFKVFLAVSFAVSASHRFALIPVYRIV